MSRPSYTVHIQEDIPSYLTPDDVIRAVHDHKNLMYSQPLVTGVRSVSPDEVTFNWFGRAEEEHFDGDNTNIHHYEVSEVITFIPGIGDYGKKQLTFPARFRDQPNGTKSWADAPQGVTVASHFMVIPKEGVRGAWVLEEKATVECSSIFMPFVKRSFHSAHEALCKDIIAKATSTGKDGAAELPS